MLSADPARAVYVQSPMHGVHTWFKVLVWTIETLRVSQSERETSVPCCLYLSEDSNAAVNAGRHLQELQRLSAFQQVTTKVPPAYDGRSSWFAYEDAIDDWVDINELEPEKQGPALRNRLEGEAAIHKRLLDRDRLKDRVNGVRYFKS